MKNKLKFLIKASLDRKFKTKWFVAANILIFAIVVGLFNLDLIIKKAGGSFNETEIIYVHDENNIVKDRFKEHIKDVNKLLNAKKDKYKIKEVKDLKEVKEKIQKDKKGILLDFSKNESQQLKVKFSTFKNINITNYNAIVNAINLSKSEIALLDSQIDKETLASIYAPAELERLYLSEDKTTAGEKTGAIMSTVFPAIIYPFFTLIIFLVQMIGAEVNDEKSTRGMEIIISSVSPKIHFFAKVIAGNIFVISQALLLFLYGFIGVIVRILLTGGNVLNIQKGISGLVSKLPLDGILNQLGYVIPLTLILMLLTFIAYAMIAGVLASMTTNIEDYQQVQTPIILISLIGYFLAVGAGSFDGSILIKMISYIPLISAILSPALLVIGQIGVVDVLISIIIMIATNFVLYKYGMKIYKVGLLNYSSKGMFKKMIKAIKER